ncbi:MAG: SH3 domain-containing protein [Spirochaetota bacterium]
MRKILLFFLAIFLLQCKKAEKKITTTILHKEGVVADADGVRMRAKPTVQSERIGYLPDKARMLVLDDSSGPMEEHHKTKGRWLQVQYEGKTGWVFGGFVRVETREEKKEQIVTPELAQTEQVEDLEIQERSAMIPSLVGDNLSTANTVFIHLQKNEEEIKEQIGELFRLYKGESGLSIAVIPSQKTGTKDARRLTSLLRKAVFEDGRFQLIERESLDKVLKEQSLGQMGSTEAIEVGKLAGAKLLLIPVVNEGIIEFKIVETKSGTILSYNSVNIEE